MEEEGYRTVREREREAGKEARQTGRRRITDEAHARHHPELEDICAPPVAIFEEATARKQQVGCPLHNQDLLRGRREEYTSGERKKKKEEERNEQPSMNANQRGSASR